MSRRIRRPCFAAALAAAGLFSGCGGIAILPADGEGGAASTGSTSSSSATQASTSTGTPTCDSSLHTISPSDYDLKCNDASDCVAVFLGDLCQGCDCKLGAINANDLAKHDADLAAKSNGIPPSGCGCPFLPPVCNAGQCDVQ